MKNPHDAVTTFIVGLAFGFALGFLTPIALGLWIL